MKIADNLYLTLSTFYLNVDYPPLMRRIPIGPDPNEHFYIRNVDQFCHVWNSMAKYIAQNFGHFSLIINACEQVTQKFTIVLGLF